MSGRGGGVRARRALARFAALALLSAVAATTPLAAAVTTPTVTTPTVTTPTVTTPKPPPPPQIYTMHVHVLVSYRVVGSLTRIRGFTLSGLPPGWFSTVRCLGRGCFSPGLHHPWRKDVRIIRARHFHPGQKLVLIFNRPYFKTVTFILKMRYNDDPRLSLYKPKPKPKPKAKSA